MTQPRTITHLAKAGPEDTGKGILMAETMLERWERRKAEELGLVEIYCGDDECEGRADGFDECIAYFESACTPRPPQAEWFGDPDTEPGKWDAWHLHIKETCGDHVFEHWTVLRGVLGVRTFIEGLQAPFGAWIMTTLGGWPFADVVECVPVARDGFPAPVGWGVVGG